MDRILKSFRKLNMPRAADQELTARVEQPAPQATGASPMFPVNQLFPSPMRSNQGARAPAEGLGRSANQVSTEVALWEADAPPSEAAARRAAGLRILMANNSSPRREVELDLDGLGLSTLPNCLANLRSVAALNVSDNNLTELPSLPPALKHLAASANQLVRLPVLPEGLIVLEVDRNSLTELPTLPHSLESLDAARNYLREVPGQSSGLLALPVELNNFDLRWNPLDRCPLFTPGVCNFALSTHFMTDTTYLQQISGRGAHALQDTHVLGTKQESPPFRWDISLPDYQ